MPICDSGSKQLRWMLEEIRNFSDQLFSEAFSWNLKISHWNLIAQIVIPVLQFCVPTNYRSRKLVVLLKLVKIPDWLSWGGKSIFFSGISRGEVLGWVIFASEIYPEILNRIRSRWSGFLCQHWSQPGHGLTIVSISLPAAVMCLHSQTKAHNLPRNYHC